MIPEIAARALDILDDKGWTQHVCADSQGRVCMGTALALAAGLPLDGQLTPAQLTTWVSITDAVMEAIGKVLPGTPFDPGNAVPKLNDFGTEQDVRKVLEAVASSHGNRRRHEQGPGVPQAGEGPGG